MPTPSQPKRFRFYLSGIVQGVGFRPFVYNLAQKLSLTGFVLNNGEGVTIEVQGDTSTIEAFISQLKLNTPRLARIDSLRQEELATTQEEAFNIIASQKTQALTMVSPDIAICNDCLSEMQDPNNRRYNYPFINCTHCGPRYTIINTLPYDRPHTSMSIFPLCNTCQSEYDNPKDRRFHAQPISCYECGPSLTLLDHQGRVLAKHDEAIIRLCEMIDEGKAVAVKGLGGFHLMCDAQNSQAIQNLRKKKQRPAKPLAVMFPDLQAIKDVAKLSKAEEKLICSKEHPIVIVTQKPDMRLSSEIAGEIDKVGVFLPYTPLQHLILKQLNRPIVATSANLSDEPITIDEIKLLDRLSHVVTAVLTHDQAIVNACDDSVIMIADQQPVVLRMARGFAPHSLTQKTLAVQKILALGGNQKSTIALAFDDHIILSPHIGDLGSLESLDYLKRTIKSFEAFYDFKPDLIVHDLHPEYETTKYAQQSQKPTLAVQHHYAHALACIAEYHLDEELLAFCFDGTGYGDDHTLWGGEVLIANPCRYQRVMHLRTFKLIGGTKAIKEPRRIALALLFECFSLNEILELDLPVIQNFTLSEIKTLHHMWEKDLNCITTSSMGRLFDAIASLCDLTHIVSYEGESGLYIERAANTYKSHQYFDYIIEENIIDWEPLVREVLTLESTVIPKLFINMLVKLILDISQRYAHLPIILSGGVFQNQTLLNLLIPQLKQADIRYYIQQNTPINDGGIALGQIYHALHIQKDEIHNDG